MLKPSSLRFAIVVSKFNEEYTSGLKEGALQYLNEKGVKVPEEDIFFAPGAFEMPLIAQRLAKTERFNGVICLGCVIKGDTAHFEFISAGATYGLMRSMLKTEVPISFGIITTYTEDQAFVRSASNEHNKGREAASACFETVQLLHQIERLER